jgi:hypothetical protein
MGHKIFVSYKYADSDVKQLTNHWYHDTVRTYVDKLEEYISEVSEHIYKGETDGEDLSNLSDDTIWKKLKDRIYDSTLTIVMISKGMRQTSLPDREQWIPWEISYSLKEVSRKNISGKAVTSSSNALLAIILPDTSGSYEYFTYMKRCCTDPCRYFKTSFLFYIMQKNMFNVKSADKKDCDDGSTVYYGDSSYMITVKWEDFIKDPESYINKAYDLQSQIEKYEVYKEID